MEKAGQYWAPDRGLPIVGEVGEIHADGDLPLSEPSLKGGAGVLSWSRA
jgi:hypothetical protein